MKRKIETISIKRSREPELFGMIDRLASVRKLLPTPAITTHLWETIPPILTKLETPCQAKSGGGA